MPRKISKKQEYEVFVRTLGGEEAYTAYMRKQEQAVAQGQESVMPAAPDPLSLPVVTDRIRKREAITGPRDGDWVIMLDGAMQRLTSNGIHEFNSPVSAQEEWPVDSVQDAEHPNCVNHPCFTTDWEQKGSFRLCRDGTISHSGGNDFHNVSRRAQLVDTGETKSARFGAFEMNDPDLNSDNNVRIYGNRGIYFELPCRIYRLVEQPEQAAEERNLAKDDTDNISLTVAPAAPATQPATAITPVEYTGLQAAYEHFNAELFDDALPNVFIVYQRRAHSFGHFRADRFMEREGSGQNHELALNPDGFLGRSDKEILATLCHEMVHVWDKENGTASKGGYHNKIWAAKMKAIGLYPSNSGMVGGRETGARMFHYIIADGPFEQSYERLCAKGWKLHLQSAPLANNTKSRKNKSAFRCPECTKRLGQAWPRCGVWAMPH
jgi:hypothetical protein